MNQLSGFSSAAIKLIGRWPLLLVMSHQEKLNQWHRVNGPKLACLLAVAYAGHVRDQIGELFGDSVKTTEAMQKLGRVVRAAREKFGCDIGLITRLDEVVWPIVLDIDIPSPCSARVVYLAAVRATC